MNFLYYLFVLFLLLIKIDGFADSTLDNYERTNLYNPLQAKKKKDKIPPPLPAPIPPPVNDPNVELQAISDRSFEKAKQAQEKEISVARCFQNIAEVVNALNEAAQMHDEAAIIVYEARNVIGKFSNAEALTKIIKRYILEFQANASRCRKEAAEWPGIVQRKLDNAYAEINGLKKECLHFEQKRIWSGSYDAYKRIAMILKSLIESGEPDNGDFDAYLQKMHEINTQIEEDRLIHPSSDISYEDFQERELFRREKFFCHKKGNDISPVIATAIDGQGSFLYTDQYYRYLVQRNSPATKLHVKVLENSVTIHEEMIEIPVEGDIWENYLVSNAMLLIPKTALSTQFGLDLRLTRVNDPYHNFSLVIAQRASDTKYEFSVFLDNEPLYDSYFICPPPWQLDALKKPSLSDICISLIPSTKLHIKPAPDDGSRHWTENISYPVLDQFIKDMKSDPLALAQYVYNEIELVDPFLFRNPEHIFFAPSISRDPLRTFLESQGSVWEQCMLLVYMLRHAGYEAQYIKGRCVLPAHYVEQLLFLQLPEEKEILLDYPGILFSDGQNWYTLYPWMKEIETIEGYDLYSLMPDEYGNAELWLKQYLCNDENILKHIGPDDNDTVGFLFVRFVEEQLRNQGLSLQDVGTHRKIKKKQFNTFEEFPQPTLKGDIRCTTNLLHEANLFTLIQVKIFSKENPKIVLKTDWLNLSAFSCGSFAIYFSSKQNQHLLHICFDNDWNNKLTMPFGINDHNIVVEVLYKTHVGLIHDLEKQQQFTIAKGTSAALCFHAGSSNAKITSIFAEQLNQKTTSQEKQQALLAFIGASYFEKCSQSFKILAALHKVESKDYFFVGLSKLSPDKHSITNLVFPQVDMQLFRFSMKSHKHPFSLFQEAYSAARQYEVLRMAEISSNEHQVLRDIYKDPFAISTVKLLQIAHKEHKIKGLPGPGFLYFTSKKFAEADTNPESARLLHFSHLEGLDFNQIRNKTNAQWSYLRLFFKNNSPNYSFAYMTPGPISSLDNYGLTSPSYKGFGTLAFSPISSMALISFDQNTMNGGFGSRLPIAFIEMINKPDWQLVSDGKNYNFSPTKTAPLFNEILSGKFPFNNPLPINNYSNNEATGTSPWKSDPSWMHPDFNEVKPDVRFQYKPSLDMVSDPVDVVSGAFYIDEIDLSLPGAFPLEFRRNYNSQNPLLGVFGYGWKSSLNPILFEEEDKLFASEQDGTVIAYRRVASKNRWIVLPEDNPGLKNFSVQGIGGTANPFHAYIEKDNDQYFLYGTDGSKRVFHNKLLQTWSDHSGNALSFSYENEKLKCIENSSGGLICFGYNYGGKIAEIYTKDGRKVEYTYDFQGNLSSVKLPNGATITYEYDRMHRIIRETKPHGRVLENIYKENKVVEQLSPVGQEQRIITSAKFTYGEGITVVTDGTGGITEYKIYNNQIYKITDPEGNQTLQSWFLNNETYYDAETEMILSWNEQGAYPRSLKSSKDKRGLSIHYRYDNKGNPMVISHEGEDLTGNGDTSISKTFLYDINNLCIQEDTLNTKTVTIYDPFCLFLPKRVEKFVDGILISFMELEYTSKGLVKQSNYSGAITLWEYDARDFPAKKIQKTGTDDPDVVTLYHFNDQGQCVDLVTADATEHNEYDIMGNKWCRTVSIPSGKEISKTYAGYDLNNMLVWKQGDDLNDTIFLDYNAAGQLKDSRVQLSQIRDSKIEPAGFAYTLYEYDACGRVAEKVDPLGNCTYFKYNGLGRVAGMTKDGLTTSYTYEAGGLVASTTYPGGATATCSYTTNGHLKSENNPDGTQSVYHYDFLGRQVKIVKNEVVSTIHYHDAALEEIRSQGDFKEICRFDAHGNVVSMTDKAGFTWTKTYDALNRIKTDLSPDGEITTWKYQENTIICTLPSGESTIQRLEGGIVVESKTIAADGTLISETSCKLDPSQNMTQEIFGDMMVTTWRNTLGQPIRIKQGEKATTHHYDPCGNCVSTIDGEGNITFQQFDPSGRLIQKTLADGAVIIYEYDCDSNLIAYCMPGELSWKASYDNMGRKIAEWQESKGKKFQQWNYLYQNGLLIQKTDPLKRLHHYKYDSHCRLSQENIGSHSRLYSYDPRGFLVSVTESGNDTSQVERNYDASGRLIQEIVSLNGKVVQNSSQSWTASSRTLQIGEHKRGFHFEGGRVKSLSTKDISLSYEYALSCSLVKKTTPFSAVKIHYNDSSLPRTLDIQIADTTYLETLEWTAGGKLSSYQSTFPGTKSSTFNYNPRGCLKSTEDAVFDFDFDKPGNGMRTGAPQLNVAESGLDEFGRIVREIIGQSTFSTAYDEMGQVFLHNKDQYEWDPWGRLIAITNNKYEWKASYDALGRRLQTVYMPYKIGNLFTTNGQALVTKSFYDPQNEFQEIGISYGNDIFWKLYGATSCEAIHDSSGNIAVLQHDIRNNLQAIVTAEKVLWNLDYPTPYGPKARPEKEDPDLLAYAQSLTWQSKRMDPTGLIWLGARYYDPVSGRFLSTDPVSHPVCMDLYAYANGDPINNMDLDGRFSSPAYKTLPSTNISTTSNSLPQVRSSSVFEEYVASDNRSRRFDLGLPELPNGRGIGFHNGIMNDWEDCRNSVEYLSKLSGGFNVKGSYGASLSVVGNGLYTRLENDLIACIYALKYSDTGRIFPIHDMWNDHFMRNPEGTFLMFCHSRGAIDVRNAALSYDEEKRKRIIIVAIAPAGYIYRETCARVTHYRVSWYHDPVPCVDIEGKKREASTTVNLLCHPSSSWIDHNFQSPTYEEMIVREIQFYLN